MGIAILARHPVIELGRQHLIHVWVSNQGPEWKHEMHESNLDLAILLAYQLAQNWGGRIALCMSVPDDATREKAVDFLEQLISLARLPKTTEINVTTSPFSDALVQAPRADLSIFGLSHHPDIAFVQQLASQVNNSCVFVRDSGDESILA